MSTNIANFFIFFKRMYKFKEDKVITSSEFVEEIALKAKILKVIPYLILIIEEIQNEQAHNTCTETKG